MPKRCFKSMLGIGGLLGSLVFAMPARAELVFSDAWLRAVPPVSPTMAGYVSLENDSDKDLMITGVRTDIAGHTMLHAMTTAEDGTRQMTHLHHLTIPARGKASLSPGEKHLMLMKLKRVPSFGESVDICFQLAGDTEACTPFTVKRPSQFDG